MSVLEQLIAKVEELDKGATKAPWRPANGKGVAAVKGPECAIYINVRTVEVDECVERWQRDAELVATYRNVLPAMAKALQRAHVALERVQMIARTYNDAETGGNYAMIEASEALTEIESLLSEGMKEAQR